MGLPHFNILLTVLGVIALAACAYAFIVINRREKAQRLEEEVRRREAAKGNKYRRPKAPLEQRRTEPVLKHENPKK